MNPIAQQQLRRAVNRYGIAMQRLTDFQHVDRKAYPAEGEARMRAESARNIADAQAEVTEAQAYLEGLVEGMVLMAQPVKDSPR